METRIYNGVVYRRENIAGLDPKTRGKWEGGPVGGVFFLSAEPMRGPYVLSGEYWQTFEEAAESCQARYRKAYLNHKRFVDEYEAALAKAETVMRKGLLK